MSEEERRQREKGMLVKLAELWQPDSSNHQWWLADDKQALLLAVDDSGCGLA